MIRLRRGPCVLVYRNLAKLVQKRQIWRKPKGLAAVEPRLSPAVKAGYELLCARNFRL